MTTGLTPEELDVLNSTNKNIFKYFVLPLIGLIVIVILATQFFSEDSVKISKPYTQQVNASR